jgi:hypothetical protein
MTNEIKRKISDELLNPTFEMTRQYLKILQVQYEENSPNIEGIEIDETANSAKAFVEIKNESFYLEFGFSTSDGIEISYVDTIPFINVSFTPTSEELTLEQLLILTTLKPNKTVLKGDSFSSGTFENNYNGLEFNSFTEPGRLEKKLESLLDILETDKDGVKELIRQTNCKDVFITIVYHIGNGNFTGLYLDSLIIDRLSKMGLQLTFDIYAGGRFSLE